AVRVAGIEHRLLADDAGALDLLDLAVAVGDDPVPTAQLDARRALVRDRDEVGERVAVLFGRGVLLEVGRLDRHPNAFGHRGRHGPPLQAEMRPFNTSFASARGRAVSNPGPRDRDRTSVV